MPRSVSRAVEESLSAHYQTAERAHSVLAESGVDIDINNTIKELEEEMIGAANNLEFERAALLRDQIRELKRAVGGGPAAEKAENKRVTYRTGRRPRGPGRKHVPF